MIRYGIII